MCGDVDQCRPRHWEVWGHCPAWPLSPVTSECLAALSKPPALPGQNDVRSPQTVAGPLTGVCSYLWSHDLFPAASRILKLLPLPCSQSY